MAPKPRWILSVPGCWNAQISAEQRGAVVEGEVAIVVSDESEPILTGPGIQCLVSHFFLAPTSWDERWPDKWKGPQHKARGPTGPGGPKPTQLTPVWSRRVSIVAMCAPEGVPSSHEEGEARPIRGSRGLWRAHSASSSRLDKSWSCELSMALLLLRRSWTQNTTAVGRVREVEPTAVPEVPALCDIGVLTLQREGGDSVREPPTAAAPGEGKRKVCYVQCCGGHLQPLTLTHSTLCLQTLRGTRLNWTPFLSVGSKREDLQSMLEIFLSGERSTAENSICGRTASSRSLTKLVVTSGLLVPHGARAPLAAEKCDLYARSSAGPRIHCLDAPQTAGRGRLKPGNSTGKMDSGRHDQSLVLGRSRPGYEDHESGVDMRRWPSSTSTTRMALSDAISSLASGSQASDHYNGESCIRRENAERKRSTNQSESGDIGSGISGVRDRNNAEPSPASDELHTASSNNEGLPRGQGFFVTLATALKQRDGRRTPWPKQQQSARRQPWRVQGSFWNASRRAPDPDIADEQHTAPRAVDPVGSDNRAPDPDVADEQHTSLRAVDPVGTDNATVRSEGDVSLDPSLNADDVGDIKRNTGLQGPGRRDRPVHGDRLGGGVVDTETPAAQFYAGSPTDLNGCVGTSVRAPLLFGPSLEDPPEDEPTPLQCVNPSEGDALGPPGIYDSNATSGERGLEPIASTEISSLRTTTEHSNVTARGSGGLDPPSHAFFPIQDNGVIDGEGQLNILTLSGDSQQQRQQQRSCLDPPIINNETVEDDTAKQSTRDHDLVTEPSKSMRLALWGLWSGLMRRLVGSGLGLALLLASGWFIDLSLEPLHRNSIQQHFIMPSCPSSLGGNALEWEAEVQEIEVDDGLPTFSSPFSLRTNTKPANDDALCDDPSSTSLVHRVSEGDERVVEQTYTTAYTHSRLQSLLPTSTSMMAHDSDPEGDGNFLL
ncbi:hypothetical protein THAOC_18952 [Thalassiosira oceanica]|uniref:Uncharacterized protein n=1 Tax=Thalassiosira oceanica TaxID=159749 RepID=K0S5Y6_THAOC|nr:hypothetical protein THAOC_18952 [Thalassiosira oceanica]|eukprot:EJK60655.1 hypothetical protein THAOC_18952 [Thalassiosira oceanica]